jgi:hypothetical protein
MEFKKFYMREAVNDWMNMVLEELAIPQSYSEREFAEKINKIKSPQEFEGMKLISFDHGKAGEHNMIITFAIDKEGLIKYLAYGDEVNPSKVMNPMSGESQEQVDQNPLYQRSVAKDADGHISTKQIEPPFIQ